MSAGVADARWRSSFAIAMVEWSSAEVEMIGHGLCVRERILRSALMIFLVVLKLGVVAEAVGMWAKASISPRSPAARRARHGTRGKRSRSAKRIVHISTALFSAPDQEGVDDEASLVRSESPLSLRRWALWTMRSRMASARVGSPMRTCHWSTGTWLVMRVAPLP